MYIYELPNDILLAICDFLESDRDKLNLLISKKSWTTLISLIKLDNLYTHHLVKDKKYYNQIQNLNIVMRTPNLILPKNIKKVYINNGVIPANTYYTKIGNSLYYYFTNKHILGLSKQLSRKNNIEIINYADFPIIVAMSTTSSNIPILKMEEFTLNNIDDIHELFNKMRDFRHNNNLIWNNYILEFSNYYFNISYGDWRNDYLQLCFKNTLQNTNKLYSLTTTSIKREITTKSQKYMPNISYKYILIDLFKYYYYRITKPRLYYF